MGVGAKPLKGFHILECLMYCYPERKLLSFCQIKHLETVNATEVPIHWNTYFNFKNEKISTNYAPRLFFKWLSLAYIYPFASNPSFCRWGLCKLSKYKLLSLQSVHNFNRNTLTLMNAMYVSIHFQKNRQLWLR